MMCNFNLLIVKICFLYVIDLPPAHQVNRIAAAVGAGTGTGSLGGHFHRKSG